MTSEFVSFIGDSFCKKEDTIKVLLRIRPPFENEKDDVVNFEVVSGQQLNVRVPESSWTYKNIKRHNLSTSFSFEFSHVFDWNSSQKRVFSSLVDSLMLDFLSGRNGLLFTYGTTNSGKTHTLIGKSRNPGVLPQAINYLFSCLSHHNIAKSPVFRKCHRQGVIESTPDEILSSSNTKNNIISLFFSSNTKEFYISDETLISNTIIKKRVKKNKTKSYGYTSNKKEAITPIKIFKNKTISNLIKDDEKISFDRHDKLESHHENKKDKNFEIENLNNFLNNSINTAPDKYEKINTLNNDNLKDLSEKFNVNQLNNNHSQDISQIKSNLFKDISKTNKLNESSDMYQNFSFKEFNDEQINLGVDVLDIPPGVITTHYVYISIAEIYNEQVFDLLESAKEEGQELNRKSLKIVGDNQSGFFVKNLNSVLVCNSDEAFKILRIGLHNRKIAETKMNANSSRSHVLYFITLIRSTEMLNGSIANKMSEICFVDLAGAERQKTSSSEGLRLREASNINKSLLFLNRCIQELRETRITHTGKHIPYRESKLTQLLQPYFVGKARMTLLINISPCCSIFDDTFSVLRFSSLAKQALDRPLGVELAHAIKLDAVIANSDDVDLEKCQKSELIDFIQGLRLKLVNTTQQFEAYDSILRDEMCQFTSEMMIDMATDHEHEIEKQRTFVTETFLNKIEILQEEISRLRSNKISKNNLQSLYLEIDNLQKVVAEKEENFTQLMGDVNSFKADSRSEIESLEAKINELKENIIDKNNEINGLNSEICLYKIKINELSIKISTYEKEIKNIESEKKSIFQKSEKLQEEITKLLAIHKKNKNNICLIKELDISGIIEILTSITDNFKEYKSHCGKKTKIYHKQVLIYRNNLQTHISNALDLKNRIEKLQSERHDQEKLNENNTLRIKDLYIKLEEFKSKFLIRTAKLDDSVRIIEDKLISCSIDRKAIENLNKKHEEEIKSLNQLESQNISLKKDAKIKDLESQLKSYKDLSEEYRLNIKRLEDTITERKIMAPLAITPVFDRTKRAASPSFKENYEGIFSKKNKK